MLQAVEILKSQWVGEVAVTVKVGGGWFRTFPLPIFGVPIGKDENVTVLMPPGGNIEPVVDGRGIKEVPVVEGQIILINKCERPGGISDLAGLAPGLGAPGG